MRVANKTIAVLLFLAGAPGAGLAQVAEEAAVAPAPEQPALHMPGNRGEDGATVRINRGSGLAPLPVSSPRSGAMGDASRPVTVTDEFIEKNRRATEPHRWGVYRSTTLRSSKRYYIGHVGKRKKKWAKHRRHDHVGRHTPHRSRHHYGKHHRKWGKSRYLGSGILVRTGDVKLWVGF